MTPVSHVIFVGDFIFPDGDAAASRTLSLARMCRDLGYRVIVVANGASRPQDFRDEQGRYSFDGISYMTVSRPSRRMLYRVLHPIERLTAYATALESLRVLPICGQS